MSKSIESRKKSGPLMPKWLAIKGRNKALSNGSFFKPDITPAIKGYDDTLKTYDDLQEQKKKLKTCIDDVLKVCRDYGDKIGAHKEALVQVTEKDQQSIQKADMEIRKFAGASDIDIAAVTASLSNFGASSDGFTNTRKAIWERITALAEQKVAAVKKARDDFKSQGDAVTNGLKKVETDADKFEGQIRQIVQGYAKAAVDMDHDEIQNDVRKLLDAF
jgi:phage-related protein